MSMESRLKKIEDSVGITPKPKTLDEMLQAFGRGEYGNIADLLRMILAGTPVDQAVRYGYPKEVVTYLMEIK